MQMQVTSQKQAYFTHSPNVHAYFQSSADGIKPPPRHHTLKKGLTDHFPFAPDV